MEIRKDYQMRTVGTKIRQAEGGGNIIEGYFIRFNEPTELFPGCFETVLPEALKNFDANDLRALWNHNTQYVIGRGSNNTIEAKKDDKGLWARIILPDVSYARDLHGLVKDGYVDQCSFGFNILDEELIEREDGTIMFALRDIDLHEISVVTFPAYPTTSVEAREQLREYQKIKLGKRKTELFNLIKTRRANL